MTRLLPAMVLFVAASSLVTGQTRGRRGGGGYGEGGYSSESAQTAREIPSHSTGTPVWTNPNGFAKDVFTFARVRYTQGGYGGGGYGGYYGRGGGSGWSTDTPDSDLNLSYRLQQMTSMKVDPDGRILWLSDPQIVDFPWLYIVEPGGLSLSDEEVIALRKYLLNGGFLMFDDFWGEAAWANVAQQMKKVFPDRAFSELPLEHPLYSCVFQIKAKGQVPNVRLGEESQSNGITWERPDAREVHHRVLFDDKGRMMVFAAHNTDNGDGWEREGEYEYYFKNFSEKIAYPLGINVVFYAMTH
jgi:hypothetical protein